MGAAGAPQALPIRENFDLLNADALLQVFLRLVWEDPLLLPAHKVLSAYTPHSKSIEAN